MGFRALFYKVLKPQIEWLISNLNQSAYSAVCIIGGNMKTLTLSRSNYIKDIKLLTVVWTIFLLAVNQIAYGAGSPAQPSMTASEKREKANVYFNEGEQLQEMKKYKEASRKYEKAVKIDDKYAEAWSNLGYTYRKQGKFDWAVHTYKKAIKLKPDLAEAHEYLGEAYAEMGKFDRAEKELQILRELGSDEADELEEFIAKMKAKNN
jgi:tetratricopeptide (TPR) repeat protein